MNANLIQKVLFCAALSTLFVCSSCGNKAKAESSNNNFDQSEKESTSVQLVANIALNDAAEFVAGMPVSETSALYALTLMADWKQHQKRMDQIWLSFSQTKPKISAFSESELKDLNQQHSSLFYPFGGPDFLFSNTFFPEMDHYLLIGLERVGSPAKVKHPSQSTFKMYQNAVSDILNLSFFRTKDMKVELANDTIDGVTPIIMLLMARAEREIVSVESKRLNEQGVITTTPKGNMVEIVYFKKGTNKKQTLCYMSADLSNNGIKADKPLAAYLSKIEAKKTVTFIKSASYLMHKEYFSTIRESVLAHSNAIVQDDSGIPFRFYNPTQWELSLYGSFDRPISLFADFPQADLKEAYKTKSAKSLNFRIGYARQSNEMVARRKSTN